MQKNQQMVSHYGFRPALFYLPGTVLAAYGLGAVLIDNYGAYCMSFVVINTKGLLVCISRRLL